MVKHRRDTRAEYRRRIAKGLAKGKSRSQARGHPKPGEKSRRKLSRDNADAGKRLQFALRLIQNGQSPTAAAKEAHVAPERLRRLVKSKRLIKSGKRWRLRKGLSRQVLIYSDGHEVAITVGEKAASRIGSYMAAVRWFVQTNDVAYLKPFVGKSVKDASDARYQFETRPNALHLLANTASDTFEQVYRVIL